MTTKHRVLLVLSDVTSIIICYIIVIMIVDTIYVTHTAKVWINRVRLPILLVVS